MITERTYVENPIILMQDAQRFSFHEKIPFGLHRDGSSRTIAPFGSTVRVFCVIRDIDGHPRWIPLATIRSEAYKGKRR